MRTKLLGVLGAALTLAFVPAGAGATVIIDNTTLGYYNAGLGDLSLDSFLGAQLDASTTNHLFPIANSGGGDPTTPPVATEPGLGSADGGTQANLGSFLGNTTALGGMWSGASQAIPSTWTVNDETAIVYSFVVGPTGFDDLFVQIAVDNGVYVWLDGAYQFGAMAPSGAFHWEYSFSTGALASGTHYLQILREDHGGGTGWDILADATEGAPVPEPGTLLLLGAGLAGLRLRRVARR